AIRSHWRIALLVFSVVGYRVVAAGIMRPEEDAERARNREGRRLPIRRANREQTELPAERRAAARPVRGTAPDARNRSARRSGCLRRPARARRAHRTPSSPGAAAKASL